MYFNTLKYLQTIAKKYLGTVQILNFFINFLQIAIKQNS